MQSLKRIFKFDTFVLLLLALQSVFTGLTIAQIYFTVTSKLGMKSRHGIDKKIMNLRKRVEFVFKTLMAVALVYIFNKKSPKLYLIDYNVTFLLFMYGILLLIGNDWGMITEYFPKMSISIADE
jgi:hypothetical protein